MTLARVEVAPIAGKSGWLVANALRDRLPESDGTTPLYRLQVTLDDPITGLGVRRDASVPSERRSLRPRSQLVALAGTKVVLDATAGSDADRTIVVQRHSVTRRSESEESRVAK